MTSQMRRAEIMDLLREPTDADRIRQFDRYVAAFAVETAKATYNIRAARLSASGCEALARDLKYTDRSRDWRAEQVKWNGLAVWAESVKG